MKTEMQYSRSPLTEAVIDLRVKPADQITVETLSEIQAGREKEYPTREERIFVKGQFTTNLDEPPASGNRSHIGFSFISKDKRQVVQARLDGFTFSRLAPYESWEKFQSEARKWWDIYRSIAQPNSIDRVAVRYINRLDIPLPLRDFKDYLRTIPEVSSDLPQGLSGFFMQIKIPQDDLGGMLVVNEAIVPPPQPGVVSVLLDIDIFRDTDVPGEDHELWDFFEKLRLRKNEVFEACITEQMKELIS
jgi:uncharacterized protein (TIGR04255 family)